MQKTSCLVLALLCMIIAPAWGQSSGNAQNAPTADMTAQPNDSIEPSSGQPAASADNVNPDAQPDAKPSTPPPPSKSSLMNLKDTQDRLDEASEVNPPRD